MDYISCNMGTCDLPEIYALALGLHPHACMYISGKSLVPMLQLPHMHWHSFDLRCESDTSSNRVVTIEHSTDQ